MKDWTRRLLRRWVNPATLNRVNAISHIEERLYEADRRHARLAEWLLRGRYPGLFEFQDAGGIFSQNDEDGLLLELISEAGDIPRRFAEIGVENARECNTAVLAFVLGWSGIMVEADPRSHHAATRFASRMLQRKENQVEVVRAFATPGNINQLIGTGPLGVLSIDVDGVDYWLWEAVKATPAIVVIEYNASFGCEEAITVPDRADFDCRAAHPSGFYHGASLPALEKLGIRKGYALTGVDARGVNAFFLRKDCVTAETPARAAREVFRTHFERSRICPPQAQWDAVRHMALIRV
ncbi:MAG: hypothetical protein K2X35_02630 [Bryobacteraceae bacterium]|nr:hypothetical protein [Bryobacteraceae bacterium]